jgi:hypothetical protein
LAKQPQLRIRPRRESERPVPTGARRNAASPFDFERPCGTILQVVHRENAQERQIGPCEPDLHAVLVDREDSGEVPGASGGVSGRAVHDVEVGCRDAFFLRAGSSTRLRLYTTSPLVSGVPS